MEIVVAMFWIFLGIVVVCREALKEDATKFFTYILAFLFFVGPIALMGILHELFDGFAGVILAGIVCVGYIFAMIWVDKWSKEEFKKNCEETAAEEREIREILNQMEFTDKDFANIKFFHPVVYTRQTAEGIWRQEQHDKIRDEIRKRRQEQEIAEKNQRALQRELEREQKRRERQDAIKVWFSKHFLWWKKD